MTRNIRMLLLILVLSVIPASARESCSKNEYQCREGRCISRRFLCDGWQDCRDGADEEDCQNTCLSNEFRCPNSDICLHDSVKCNGDFDCPDGGDELQCSYPLCKSDEFQCDNGWCIHQAWKCDGTKDCLGGEDEKGCPACPDSMFQCAPNKCIPPSFVCNGVRDCANGNDEKDCCAGFECNNGQCIREEQKCNKRVDCADGSDEGPKVCGPPPCPQHMFQCGDNSCIDVERVCDGTLDCRDKSDEKQPTCYQILVMRQRMRGLYNGFDTYVSKVNTVLNYIRPIRNVIENFDFKGIRAEIEAVKRMAASGGKTVVVREQVGGSGSDGSISVYLENRVVNLELQITNIKSDIEFMKAGFATEKKERSSNTNKIEETSTLVFLQKSDVSKIGRDVEDLKSQTTTLKYQCDAINHDFATYKQNNYGMGDKISSNNAKLEEMTQKLYYIEQQVESINQRVLYREKKKRSV